MGGPAALRVFISYRRDDSAGYAGRLHDALCSRLAGAEIFMDVGGIEPGLDFTAAIADAIGRCDVMLALIGPRWTAAAGPDGSRRLDDPDDYVVAEIAAALERDIRVIPLLIEGASMPRAADLPDRMRGLAKRNAMALHTMSWPTDLEAVVAVLQRLLPQPAAPEAPVAATSPPGVGAAPVSRADSPEPVSAAPSRVRAAIVAAAALFLCVALSLFVVQALRAEKPTTLPQADGVPECYERLVQDVPAGRAKVVEEGADNLEFNPGEPLEAPVVLVFTLRGKAIGALRLRYNRGSELTRVEAAVGGETCRPVEGSKNFETGEVTETYGIYAEMYLPLGNEAFFVKFQPYDAKGHFSLRFRRTPPK